jgi:hypothetical protein
MRPDSFDFEGIELSRFPDSLLTCKAQVKGRISAHQSNISMLDSEALYERRRSIH